MFHWMFGTCDTDGTPETERGADLWDPYSFMLNLAVARCLLSQSTG